MVQFDNHRLVLWFGLCVTVGILQELRGDDTLLAGRRRVIWSSCLNYSCFAGWLLSSTYYLPIYFQAVRYATPPLSGVDLLPSVVGDMLFAGLTGGLGKE